jgi:hypothetical protein
MNARIAFAVLFPGMIAAAAVHADEDPRPAFRRFGLTGVWSPDCSHEPSERNPRAYFQVGPSGPIPHAVTFDGKTFSLVDTVTSAALLANGQFRMTVRRNGGASLTVTIERKGNKIHTVSSVGSNGTVYYRDGIEMITGKSGWCAPATSGSHALPAPEWLSSLGESLRAANPQIVQHTLVEFPERAPLPPSPSRDDDPGHRILASRCRT